MKKILVAIILMVSFNSQAGTLLASQKITKLANGWSATNLFISTDTMLFAEDCSETDRRIVLEDSHPQFDLLSSMILSAYHAKSNVRFYVDGCGSNNHMKLMSVSLETD